MYGIAALFVAGIIFALYIRRDDGKKWWDGVKLRSFIGEYYIIERISRSKPHHISPLSLRPSLTEINGCDCRK